MGGASESGRVPAGRPRQPELDERIKKSAVAVLAARGFGGLSVNRICKHAGLPRPTFYRRWNSAEAAVVDAFNDRFEDAPFVYRGNLAKDLLHFALGVRDRYDDPVISVCLPAVYEAQRTQPELIAPIEEAQRLRRRANIAAITDALAADGIRPPLPAEEIYVAVIALIDHQHRIGRPASNAAIARLIAALLGSTASDPRTADGADA